MLKSHQLWVCFWWSLSAAYFPRPSENSFDSSFWVKNHGAGICHEANIRISSTNNWVLGQSSPLSVDAFIYAFWVKYIRGVFPFFRCRRERVKEGFVRNKQLFHVNCCGTKNKIFQWKKFAHAVYVRFYRFPSFYTLKKGHFFHFESKSSNGRILRVGRKTFLRKIHCFDHEKSDYFAYLCIRIQN